MIDDIDRTILRIVQENARTTNAEIARQLDMAPSAILERIRKLEARGYIEGWEARLNPRALDQGLLAFIYVRADEPIGSEAIGKELADLPQVQEVHHVAGEDCYLVKVRARNTEDLGRLLKDSFGKHPSVQSTRTTIVLSTIKETARLSVDDSTEGNDG